jgi:flavin reductase (DIM6/NTAB) family NADH-FMN oxidoreductase RutF
MGMTEIGMTEMSMTEMSMTETKPRPLSREEVREEAGIEAGVDDQAFKAVMAQWATGVTIATTRQATTHQAGAPVGMTVSSFASVSLHPPQILICVNHRANTHAAFVTSGFFAVNMLAADQQAWGMRFAGQQPEVGDRFADIAFTTAATGAPILPGVLGWLDCRVQHAFASGDHTIFVGAVVACALGRAVTPLLYFQRQWQQLAAAHPLP